jgi:hypothetical protein
MANNKAKLSKEFDFVNFEDEPEKDKKDIVSNYYEYDKTTIETYRINRLLSIDPILNEKISEELNFKFKDKWDPLTGIRTTIDEIGPLCFNAGNVYKFYMKNRTNGLWNPPTNDNTGYFQGYYGDLVGSGINININSRGSFPEKYLFRLPIVDCYLSKNHNHSLVTMGPILSDAEINEIDYIIAYKSTLKNQLKLSLIKKWYDKAITDDIDYNKLRNKYNLISERDIKDKYNRKYVDKLVAVKFYL